MNNLKFIFLIFLLLILILVFINLLINKKMLLNREKKTPFECGFNPMSNARMPFSIKFFIISLIFLIFDVEIALLFPLIFIMKKLYLYMIFSFWMFMMILLFGLYLEWMEKSLNWLI